MIILDPANDADDYGYSGIRDLGSITATDTQIDQNPLFGLAESFIVKLLPDVSILLTGTDQGRSYPQRSIVVQALILLCAAYLKRGGGSVGGETVTQGSGAVKSKSTTIGPVTRREDFDVGSSASRSAAESLGTEDQADWLEEQAFALLEGLGANISDVSSDGNYVLLTDSKLC